MKLLLVVLIFSFSLNANEMKRIEAIVDDISKLRVEYEGCQTESRIYELQLKDERDKNRILLQEVSSFENLYKKEIEYENKIIKLENRIKEQAKLLKIKENSKKDLKIKVKEVVKIKEKDKNTLINEEKTLKNIVLLKCDEANPFPKLIMKKEFLEDTEKTKKPKNIVEEKIEKFKASAFRVNKNATIYDSINGKRVEEWGVDTSFTSSLKSQNWVKITGYFVDRVWMRSSKEIWIKLSDVTKR